MNLSNFTHEPKIFILLPAFNEGKNLETLIPSTAFFMARTGLDFEIVCVNDGSHDNSKLIMGELKKQFPFLTGIHHNVNQGLGAAIKTGLDYVRASGKPNDILVTLDSDNSHPPGTINLLLQKIFEGNELVIASRYRQGSRVIGVPFFRQFLSVLARLAFQLRYPIPGVRDYTCGFRAYQLELINRAVQKFKGDFVNKTGFEVMADVLIKLRTLDPVCSEVPLVLRYDLKLGASKMKVFRTIKKTLRLVLTPSPQSP